MRRLFLSAAVVFFFTGSALADLNAPGGNDPQQMQDFNIAGYNSKGGKTWDVQGASMDMIGDDVKIDDITARLYPQEPGAQGMVLTADHGRMDKASGKVRLEDNVRAVTETGAELTTSVLDYSQKEQLISTDQKVNIKRDDMQANGVGLEAHPDMKVAKLQKDVEMTVPDKQVSAESKANAKAGAAVQAPDKMVITCDGPMELDYEKQVATFEKNVHVSSRSDQGDMVSDRMTVYFDKTTKQIDKIVAVGHVKITRDGNTSYSETAIFSGRDKRMILSGQPQLVMYVEEGTFNVSP